MKSIIHSKGKGADVNVMRILGACRQGRSRIHAIYDAETLDKIGLKNEKGTSRKTGITREG